MLCAIRVISEASPVVCMLTLHLLQKHDVGVQLAQALAQFMHHHPLIEMGEALMDIVGSDSERLHDASFYPITVAERSVTRHLRLLLRQTAVGLRPNAG